MGKKCPRCGSRQTAEILYGYPLFTEELQQKLSSGELALGGCCIASVEVNGRSMDIMPSRRCFSCRRDFGREPVLISRKNNTAEDYREIVTAIQFRIGGYFEGFTEVSIRKLDQGALVNVLNVRSGKRPVEDKQISEAEWKKIVDKLYGKLYLHEWKKNYVDSEVLDGTQWELEISLIGKRKRSYGGSNAYPPYWKELLKLFGAYTEIKED